LQQALILGLPVCCVGVDGPNGGVGDDVR